MSTEQQTSSLLLPDLCIEGFRGLRKLRIPQLGLVTLLTGQNSVGKTTVLDAVRVYAQYGRYTALAQLLKSREEYVLVPDVLGDDGEREMRGESELNFSALFHGRDLSGDPRIAIGPQSASEQLTIKTGTLNRKQMDYLQRSLSVPLSSNFHAIKSKYQKSELVIPWLFSPQDPTSARLFREFRRRAPLWLDEERLPPILTCESLGPGLLNNVVLARFWDEVLLTENESQAVDALNTIFNGQVERIGVVGDFQDTRIRQRRVLAKFVGNADRIPLKSLGDGALRLLGTALALANSRNGFLLIDEAENGIHYSLQPNYWRMVLQMAKANNVQVLATTHGWDCFTGFAQAATESDEVEGVLIRIDKEGDEVRAVQYTEEELVTAAEQGIEVR